MLVCSRRNATIGVELYACRLQISCYGSYVLSRSIIQFNHQFNWSRRQTTVATACTCISPHYVGWTWVSV